MVGIAPFGASPPSFCRGRIFSAWSWSARLGHKNMSRERFSASSLPGLTRQSMRGAGLLRLTAVFDSLHASIDHRVKPGGDDEEGETRGYPPGTQLGTRNGHAARRPAGLARTRQENYQRTPRESWRMRLLTETAGLGTLCRG